MFHENLIQLRKINHLSQEQLAERLQVSRHEPVIIGLN